MGSPRQLELPCCRSTGVRSLGPVQDRGRRLDPSSAGATWRLRTLQGWGCLFKVKEIEDQGGEGDVADLVPFVCGGCGSSRFRVEVLPWDQDPPGPLFEYAVPSEYVASSRGP
jgi:hypothetical protein